MSSTASSTTWGVAAVNSPYAISDAAATTPLTISTLRNPNLRNIGCAIGLTASAPTAPAKVMRPD